MILLQVNFIGVTVSKFEGDTPWPVHVDRIARRFEASQLMEPRPGEVHVLWTPDLIEAVQQAKDASLQARIDPARPAFFPKLGQRFVLKVLITGTM